MQRAPLLAMLLLAVPLSAGCLGGDDASAEERVRLKNRAAVSDRAGGIEGLVTDPAIAPVAAADVFVIQTGATTSTADDGSFAFSNVAPGAYTLQVSAEGYIGTELPVEVLAGRVSTVDIILAVLPSTLPFFQTREFTGFVECSVRTPAVGVAVCAIPNTELGGNVTNDRFLFSWPVEPDLWQLTAELSWEANNPAAAWMSFPIEPIGIPNEGQTFYARGFATTPIVHNVQRDRILEVDANMTAICNGELAPDGTLAPQEPDAYCRDPLVEAGGEIWARIFVDGETLTEVPDDVPEVGGNRVRFGLAVQQ
ncbi:MAG: carboxypeptidase-like regulatory domain-containing protein, partial [bacterium]